jgi:peroxiredoxin
MFIGSSMFVKLVKCLGLLCNFRLIWLPLICITYFKKPGFANADLDFLLSIDARSIESSGVSRWLENKYPQMSQWADNFDRDLDQEDEILNAMGLRENDFTHFTAVMNGIDALADNNNSNQLSFSDLFLSINIIADKPMDLPRFLSWFKKQLRDEFTTGVAQDLDLGEVLTKKSLKFILPISNFYKSVEQSESQLFLDMNLSVDITLDGNKTMVNALVSHSTDHLGGSFDISEKRIPLLDNLSDDRQISFYFKLPDSLREKIVGNDKFSNPLFNAFAGVQEIAWGVSFREESISLELLIECLDEVSANGLNTLYQGSLGVAQLALAQELKARVALIALRNMNSEIRENCLQLSMELNSSVITEIVSASISALSPMPPIEITKIGARRLEGSPAPNLFLPMLSGEDFNLAQQKGKVVVLGFWATWSGPSIRNLPLLLEATREFNSSELKLVSVNKDASMEELLEFINQYNLHELSILLDENSSAYDAFDVKGLPHTVVIDQGGIVHDVAVGFSPFQGSDLKRMLTKLIK